MKHKAHDYRELAGVQFRLAYSDTCKVEQYTSMEQHALFVVVKAKPTMMGWAKVQIAQGEHWQDRDKFLVDTGAVLLLLFPVYAHLLQEQVETKPIFEDFLHNRDAWVAITRYDAMTHDNPPLYDNTDPGTEA